MIKNSTLEVMHKIPMLFITVTQRDEYCLENYSTNMKGIPFRHLMFTNPNEMLVGALNGNTTEQTLLASKIVS